MLSLYTLYTLDKLPELRRLTDREAEAPHRLVYDAITDEYRIAEPRCEDLARVMIEAATKFFERGL